MGGPASSTTAGIYMQAHEQISMVLCHQKIWE